MDEISFETAFFAFVALFVLSRVISRSAVNLLDDAAKLLLVDAGARAVWWYLPLLAVVALSFWRWDVGAAAFILFALSSMAYNVAWYKKNNMPKAFMTRILVSNGIVVLGLAGLVFVWLQ